MQEPSRKISQHVKVGDDIVGAGKRNKEDKMEKLAQGKVSDIGQL